MRNLVNLMETSTFRRCRRRPVAAARRARSPRETDDATRVSHDTEIGSMKENVATDGDPEGKRQKVDAARAQA